MNYAGIDLALRRHSVIAVIKTSDEGLAMGELLRFNTKKELQEIVKGAGIREMALDCPIYLPRKGRLWREEEQALWEMDIPCFPPGGGQMPRLHSRARELLGLGGRPKVNGFATGLRGKCKVYEVYPHATFVILSRAGFYGPLANKMTGRGQVQRLMLLAEFIPDLGKDIWQKLDPDALDAVAAALTHFFIEKGVARKLGKCLWAPPTSPPEGSSSP